MIHEALPALAALKARGLVRHIGISGLPFKALRHIVENLQSPAHLDLILSYCHYCLNDACVKLGGAYIYVAYVLV